MHEKIELFNLMVGSPAPQDDQWEFLLFIHGSKGVNSRETGARDGTQPRWTVDESSFPG
ncbi:MAG: hypothetical protein ACLFQR_12605 [Desulfovibrionales bacterium]